VRHYQEPDKKFETMRGNEMVEQNHKLVKYQGVTSLSRADAMEIMETVWPGAPAAEKTRAAMLCASHGLNPLMQHVYLVPFGQGKDQKWATIMGINATRLLASRKGPFSYVDDTPRIMTDDEQVRVFGSVNAEQLMVIVKVMDPRTKAEAPGYGAWPKSKTAYGGDKGNTQFNMAAIRAERQALSRLRPGDVPQDVEVMDDALAESMSHGTMVTTVEEYNDEPDDIDISPAEPEPEPESIDVNPEDVIAPRNELLATPEHIAELTKPKTGLFAKMGWTGQDLAAYCKGRNQTTNTREWSLNSINDLKEWQYEELRDMIKTTLEI
jgi:hypothetical protein